MCSDVSLTTRSPKSTSCCPGTSKPDQVKGVNAGRLLIERLWRSLKYEAVYLQDIADGFAAQRVIDEWMHFYNRERPHSALGKATPDEAYGATNELKKAA
jgi:putative transposase